MYLYDSSVPGGKTFTTKRHKGTQRGEIVSALGIFTFVTFAVSWRLGATRGTNGVSACPANAGLWLKMVFRLETVEPELFLDINIDWFGENRIQKFTPSDKGGGEKRRETLLPNGYRV